MYLSCRNNEVPTDCHDERRREDATEETRVAKNKFVRGIETFTEFYVCIAFRVFIEAQLLKYAELTILLKDALLISSNFNGHT